MNESLQIKQNRHQSPPSGSPKLVIKLMIPKQGDDDVHHKEDHDQINSGEKVCQHCNKTFSNGKALGGHLRIHSQPIKDQLSLKKLKSKNPNANKLKSQELIDDSTNKDCKTANGGMGLTGKPVCSLCGKSFPSMKSLFGHMRCHPEREWRGIQPPPATTTKKNSPSSSVSDIPTPPKIDNLQIDSHGTSTIGIAVDLTESLPGWSRTARRGRKAIITQTDILIRSSEDEEKLRDAVEDLMMLAQGNSFESGLTHKHHDNHVVEECEDTNSNSMTNKTTQIEENMNRVIVESDKKRKKRKLEAASPIGHTKDCPLKKLKIEERDHHQSKDAGTSSCLIPKIIDKGKQKAVSETGEIAVKIKNPIWAQSDSNCQRELNNESNSKNSDDSVRSDQSLSGPIIMMVKSKKKRKKLKLSDLESVQDGINPADRYRCSTCNKSFPTHQALGGHRSSHNKVKNSNINNNIVVEESSSVAAEYEHTNNPPIITQFDESKEIVEGGSSSAHQCKLCDKRFPTGQALGGHQRCHYTPPVEAQSSQVTSPGEASQTGRVVLDFDLNELPPGVDDEGIAGHGYPSSSSFNSLA